MVRETRRAALRQPWHRHHRFPYPVQFSARNYCVGVVSNVTSSWLLIGRRVFVYWRAIILLLIFVCVSFLVVRFDEFCRFVLVIFVMLLFFIYRVILCFWY